MIRILNIEPDNYSRQAHQILQTVGEVEERPLSHLPTPRSHLLTLIPHYDVLITRLGFYIDAEIMAAGKQLKAIVTATTGLDHIDLVAAKRQNVTILSLRGETAFLQTVPATAEHTWALLLALVRQIPPAFTAVQQGKWNRDLFRGRDLFGKRLGIVGLGRIGQIVARYALAFGMHVQAHDPYLQTWPTAVEPYQQLDDLLAESDVVTLHVPLNEATTGLIGESELAQMRRGSCLVNTSRGAIIDERALLAVLKNGRLAGAALDVLTGEQAGLINQQHPLIQYANTHSNLLLTPHIGGATTDSMHMTEIFMAEKLRTFMNR